SGRALLPDDQLDLDGFRSAVEARHAARGCDARLAKPGRQGAAQVERFLRRRQRGRVHRATTARLAARTRNAREARDLKPSPTRRKADQNELALAFEERIARIEGDATARALRAHDRTPLDDRGRQRIAEVGN